MTGTELQLRTHSVLPEDFTEAHAHLIDVTSTDDWSVTCPGLQADSCEGELCVGTSARLCAVMVPCERCGAALEEIPESEYTAHGVRHAVREIEGTRRALEMIPDVCGLAAHLHEGHTGWLRELLDARGAGRYLVMPALSPTGTLLGRDPIRVV